jgi:hypothetical protein
MVYEFMPIKRSLIEFTAINNWSIQQRLIVDEFPPREFIE